MAVKVVTKLNGRNMKPRDAWREAGSYVRSRARRVAANMDEADKANAVTLRDAIRRKIYEGDPSWKSNSPLTVAVKGSSKPLVDRGAGGGLPNYVKSRHLPNGPWVVGVLHGERSDDGVDMATIAKVHEHGMTIKPKNATKLAIPANPEARKLAAKHESIGDIPGLFRPGNTSVLAVKGGPTGFTIMFILMDEVTIPARPFVHSTHREQVPKMVKRYKEAARLGLQGKPYRSGAAA